VAVVNFVDVTAGFDEGHVVSAAAFNDLFAAIQANFEVAKEAIEQLEPPSAGEGLVLTGTELSLDTALTDARYLNTEGGGVVEGDLTVNAPTFVGTNRSKRISPFEAFGIRTDYGAGSWGGMFVETVSPTGRPFYGYSVANGQNAWTEYDGASGQWRLYNGASFQVVVQSNGNTTINGNLTLAGTLTEQSDRAGKHAVEPVDVDAVLAAVGTLPINTWRYDHSPDVTHIGPMADDFYRAFGVGHGPSTISTIDRDGVALAAIQALHALLLQQDAHIAMLEARLAVIEGARSGTAMGSAAAE